MKNFKTILFILITIFSLGCVIYASIMQCVLCYEKFGVIFNNKNIFIPDKSAWWFLGGLGLIPFWVWCEIDK